MRNLLLVLVLFITTSGTELQAAKLTKKEYSKHSASMGVVLFDVNWGRKWGCGEYDNAQLLKLVFEHTELPVQGDLKYREIRIKTPSRLFVDPVFLGNGFIVAPGTYAFTGWSVKVANSMKEVMVADVGPERMIQGDEYLGGTFTVAAGEVVFVGNFWVDCGVEPMPWRYFTTWGEEWDTHRQQYATQFKFLKGKEIQFRLLETRHFGYHPLVWVNNDGNMALSEGRPAEAMVFYQQVLDQAEAMNDSPWVAIAMFGLGRAHGLACHYDLAVSWFERSIVLRKTLADREGAYISQNYLELGRLYASAEDWPNMIANFERGIPVLEQLGTASDDPIGYANVLEALQTAYQAMGNEAQVGQLETRIAEIRAANPGKEAKFTPDVYPADCGSPKPTPVSTGST